ncbi:hypothetical protein D9M72_396030 [compost metagenome]
MRAQLGDAQRDFLDLRGEQVDAAQDDHVVTAAGDAAHAAVRRAGGAGQQAREVLGAVADDGQRFLGQRGEHQFAVFAVAQHLRGVERVNDLGTEVVLPDVAAVLGFHGFAGHAGTHDLGEPVDVAGLDVHGHFEFVAHFLGPRLGAQHGVLERGGGRVDALLHHRVGDGEQVGGGGQDRVGLEVLDQGDLAFGLAARDRDDRAAECLGAGVGAHAAGEQAVAVGVVDLHAGADAGGAEGTGHQLGPVGEVLLGVADDGGPAGGAGARVDAGHLVLRHGKHAEGVLQAQVFLGGEGELAQVGELAEVRGVDAGLVELALV